MDVDNRLYRADQVRELDRRAIEDHGIAGFELMQGAGCAVFRVLRARWPEAERVLVCCGGGNNGGDGYLVARLAREAGLGVQVIALKAPGDLGGDARKAADDWKRAGGDVGLWNGSLPEADVIVDAMLGTGLDREVRDDYAAMIDEINSAGAPAIAVDVPSGLNADTGMPMGRCVRADVTVSFIGRKRGLETGLAPDFAGRVLFTNLDVPAAVYDDLEPDAERLCADFAGNVLPPRARTIHKGALGHVLICGGDFDMPGAVVLAARAALMTGSGLVSVATRREHSPALAGSLPEAMWVNGEESANLESLKARADVIALGPGLGRAEWSGAVFKCLLDSDLPVVLDADGLNLLAQHRDNHGFERDNWILTPHPGEAARLLNVSTAEIQRDRFAAVRELAECYNATVVLKGAGSLVAAPQGRVALCPFGNPAMATAGMGDALTGIVASVVGQARAAGIDLFDAACAGVVLHALAGDRAARDRRTILAGELIAALPRVLP